MSIQDDMQKIVKLYVDRLGLAKAVPEDDVQSVMKKRAKAAKVDKILENYINKYGSSFLPNTMVRKGEVGETAHATISYLLSRYGNSKNTSLNIYLREPSGNDQPSSTLVQRQKAAIELLTSPFGGACIEGSEAQKVNVTMADYNRHPLAMLATEDYRQQLMSYIEEREDLLSKKIKKRAADIAVSLHTSIKEYMDEGKVAILWYKNPKKKDDEGRMEHVYNALESYGADVIILMGDTFNKTLDFNLRGGGTVQQKKDEGQTADNLVIVTGGKWRPKFLKLRPDDMDATLQGNLFYQWYTEYYSALVCDARFMVCPSRTGGSHGPYFLGVPLVYLDEYPNLKSFLQERMAVHAVLDPFITPIPNIATAQGEEKIPFVESMTTQVMKLYDMKKLLFKKV
ncbi:hypothetical protein BTJ40_11835 [Microbulbifer sp. A4B17]|uniref:hypothetical protein n=1 Tax=Microbulbifer sp. A4B17 TaxID=359370 RepID=UPI000D52CE11|nr:hypothetical protein [Microbulbifer sp. A4B17]AWF81453.1 hypothetical protein BTJ40_11835 [Microbulbifer sp. A4B17]